MSYRNPIYNFHHAAAVAGASALSSSDEDSDYPLENLIDSRPSNLCIFASSAANHWIELNRGAGTLANVDRLVIPAGHNFDGATIEVDKGTGSNPGETWVASWVQSGNGVISKTGTPTARQYLRMKIATSGKWELGQFYLTAQRTPSVRGPEPAYPEEKLSNAVHVPFPTRTASLALAANRWRWDLTYRYLDGADLAVFDDLIEDVGLDLLPFYFDPPDDTTPAGPLFVKVIPGSYHRDQEKDNPPGIGAAFKVRLGLLEQIG